MAPVSLVRAYLAALPELRAQQLLEAAEVAMVPHVKQSDRRAILRGWRRQLPRRRARRATPEDLARLGIAVEEA